MTQLTTKHISLPVPSPQPAQMVPFVKPLTYEFRVAETHEDGKVTKVALQMQVWEHDEYGSGIVKAYWHDVPRIQVDKDGALLPPIL
jgi:hypothetical protein